MERLQGIPYAEPPIDSLRLRPPIPKLSLGTATFNASNYGAPCLQLGVCRQIERARKLVF